MKTDLNRIRHMRQVCTDIIDAVDRVNASSKSFADDADAYKSICEFLSQITDLSVGFSKNFIDMTRSQIPWKKLELLKELFFTSVAGEAPPPPDKDKIWEIASKDMRYLLFAINSAITEHGDKVGSYNPNATV